jgi:hypothetical protein
MQWRSYEGWTRLQSGRLPFYRLPECCVCLAAATATWEIPSSSMQVPFCNDCLLTYKRRYRLYTILLCITVIAEFSAALMLADGSLQNRLCIGASLMGPTVFLSLPLWERFGPPFLLRSVRRWSSDYWIKFKNPGYPSAAVTCKPSPRLENPGGRQTAVPHHQV